MHAGLGSSDCLGISILVATTLLCSFTMPGRDRQRPRRSLRRPLLASSWVWWPEALHFEPGSRPVWRDEREGEAALVGLLQLVLLQLRVWWPARCHSARVRPRQRRQRGRLWHLPRPRGHGLTRTHGRVPAVPETAAFREPVDANRASFGGVVTEGSVASPGGLLGVVGENVVWDWS